MRARLPLILLVFAFFAAGQATLLAQATPAGQAPASRIPGMGAPSSAVQQPPTGANVDPAATVMTIEGACDNPSATPCQTKITKADFEKLMHALDPEMPPQSRPGLADQYAKVLIASGVARKENLESQPRSQEVLRYIRLQVLANLYNQKLQEEAKEVPPADIEKYYADHKSDFDEVTMRRIYIPKNVPSDVKKPSDADIAALATDMEKRAKAGEDFGKLQQEVFDKFGIKTPPPPTDMGAQRRSNLPPDEGATIFALAPGQVSDVINNQIGTFIYKIVSKRTATLDEARAEIQGTLQRKRYSDELTKVFGPVNVKLNPEYFGPNASVSLPGHTPEPPPSPAGMPRPATPSKPPAN